MVPSVTALGVEHSDRVHVRVQLLHLAGAGSGRGVIFNKALLFELAETDHKSIFAKEATQAILDYTWMRLTRKHYIVGFCMGC